MNIGKKSIQPESGLLTLKTFGLSAGINDEGKGGVPVPSITYTKSPI